MPAAFQDVFDVLLLLWVQIAEDLLFQQFKAYQKYIATLAVVFVFFVYYFYPMLRDPLYLYSTEEIKQFKTLSSFVQSDREIPSAAQLASSVRLQNWSDGKPVGDLYPQENLKRIDELTPYLEGENYMVLLWKPLFLDTIYMNVLMIGSIILFFGYQYKKNKTTFLSTVYYRFTYNGMTDIVKFINDTVKLTTRENLTKSSSAGLELVLSTSIGDLANINIGTNVYYNTIDASGLGYSNNKSIVAWSANMSAGINLSKSSVLQITSGYTAETLTPQGKQLPTFVMNTGFKQELFKRKLAFIVTVSDVFNSLRNRTLIDTPELYEKIIRRRSARIIYAGLTYTFGNQKKKKELEYDNKL